MSILVPITLIGWIFVAIILFTLLPARRAVLVAYIAAWLFLPQAGIDLPGVPDLNKMNATSLGALMGVLLFDSQRLFRYRVSWVDLPMIVWCLSSIPSSLLNELPRDATSPLYDGISGVVKDFLTWGAPYLIGRLYFYDLAVLRELAIAVFLGGLIYAPLCLFEIRMSPHLHYWVYGFHPSSFEMTIRMGGYRPMVFMQHGLMLAMWMACTTIVAVWLWRSRSLPRLFQIPTGLLAGGLFAVTILCRSTGAAALMLLGLAALFATRTLRTNLVVLALVAIAPIYMTVRAQGWWTGRELIELAAHINEERAESLAGRLENEDLIVAKALQKPWFGWGGWGRWRVVDEETGEDITVSDGMWVIAFGEKGLVGLASVTALVLLPVALLIRRIPARDWATPAAGPAAALAMLLTLYLIDNLFNAMLNPVYLLAAGGLSGLYLWYPGLQSLTRRAPSVWLQHAAFTSPAPAGFARR